MTRPRKLASSQRVSLDMRREVIFLVNTKYDDAIPSSLTCIHRDSSDLQRSRTLTFGSKPVMNIMAFNAKCKPSAAPGFKPHRSCGIMTGTETGSLI